MKTFIFILIAFMAVDIQAQTNCPYLTVTGGKVLAQGKPDLMTAPRGEETPIVSYDLNQDGKPDDISYWISTHDGEEAISYYGGWLLETDFFPKQTDSQVWVLIVNATSEKQPLIVIYYNASGSDDPLESTLYVFRQKDGKYYQAYETKLSYGDNPDTINFTTMKVEDAYGTGGFSEEHDLTLK